MPHDETRDRILAAAMQLWAEKGYEAASMRELSRRVGMGASTLYRYFDGKESIVLHFYERVNEQVWDAFMEEGPSGDLGADLSRYLRLKLAALTPQRSAITGLMREAIDPESRLSPLHPDSAGTLGGNVDRFASLIRAAKVADGEAAEDLGRLVWMLHMAVVVLSLHDRSGGAVTELALAQVGRIGGLVPFLSMVPGFADGLALLRRLLDGQVEEAAEEEAVSDLDHSVDVVIMGGGPIGCLTAGFLKRMRPKSSVLVLEREHEPGYHVGESTLSGLCKALRTLGVRQEAMQVLFQPKNGLGFTWAEGQELATAPEYVLETFDETFQVERRVLDALILAQVRRLGVEVMQGCTVDLGASTLKSDDCVVHAKLGRRTIRLGARWVVDATGSAAGIARSKGLWSDDGIAFQSHAVWAAFEGAQNISNLDLTGSTQFPREEYTWHLATRAGWVWWIPQVSWSDAPTANLNRAIESLLREGKLPDRDALAKQGCPSSHRVSVGWVARGDRDVYGVSKDPAEAFAKVRRAIPSLKTLLQGATLVDDLTAKGPFGSRKNIRGHARRVTGDGWLAVGDAAFFVDPLISPGLTAGTATAWQAARALADHLDNPLREELFADYESFAHQLHAALEADNQLVYHSFDDPELMALVQRFQEIAAREHFNEGEGSDYGELDTNVWGLLSPEYQRRQEELLNLLRSHISPIDQRVPVEEQTRADYAPAVEAVREMLGAFLDTNADLTPYVAQNEVAS